MSKPKKRVITHFEDCGPVSETYLEVLWQGYTLQIVIGDDRIEVMAPRGITVTREAINSLVISPDPGGKTWNKEATR